jgi:tetratricopeptide (TPR) repeat protein
VREELAGRLRARADQLIVSGKTREAFTLLVLSHRLGSAEARAWDELLRVAGKLGADPRVAGALQELAESGEGRGRNLARVGRPAEAEAEYRRALAIYRNLAEDDPRAASCRDRGADVENGLSVVLRRLGRAAEARDLCERAVAAREALLREAPTPGGYRIGLAESHLNRGLARRALGDIAGAAADARRAAALYDAVPAVTGWVWFAAARAHAAVAGLSGRPGSGVPADEGAGQADTAMARLHKAVADGYRDPDAYRNEDALDPLRGRDGFRLLMMDLEFPTEPFAAAH